LSAGLVTEERRVALLVCTLEEKLDEVPRVIDVLEDLMVRRVGVPAGSMRQTGGMHWQRLLIPSSFLFAGSDATCVRRPD